MPSTVTLYLPFAIMCMSSIPPKMMWAQRKLLNPSIGRTMRLIARWSCSVVLLHHVVQIRRLSNFERHFAISSYRI